MTDPTRRDDPRSVPRIVYRRKPGIPEVDPAVSGPGQPKGVDPREADTPGGDPLSRVRPQAAATSLTPRSRDADRVLSGPAFPVAGDPSSPLLRANRPAAASAAPGRGRRSAGIWALAALDLALAIGLALAARWLFRVKAYETDQSFDVAEELEMALAGLDLLITLVLGAAAGFVLSALAVLSSRRVGWFYALTWAGLMTLSGLGAVYGLPALIYLTAPATRRGFI